MVTDSTAEALWAAYTAVRSTENRNALVSYYWQQLKGDNLYEAGNVPEWIIDTDDNAQILALSLLQLVETYKPDRGATFNTYLRERLRTRNIDGVRTYGIQARWPNHKAKEYVRLYAEKYDDPAVTAGKKPPIDPAIVRQMTQKEAARRQKEYIKHKAKRHRKDGSCSRIDSSEEGVNQQMVSMKSLIRRGLNSKTYSLDGFVAALTERFQQEGGGNSSRDNIPKILTDTKADTAGPVDRADQVRHLLKQLPDRSHRLAMKLYWIEGLVMSETGNALGISESLVSKWNTQSISVLRDYAQAEPKWFAALCL